MPRGMAYVCDCSYHPCAYAVVPKGKDCSDLKRKSDEFERDEECSVLVDTDWEYPRLAENMGWRGLSKHEGTDGTVKCTKCGKTPTEFITEAAQYIDARIGRNFRSLFEKYFCD